MPARFFGQFLLERGRISADALLAATNHQNQHNLKLGELAVKEGLITVEVADQINREQRRQDKPFGQIARELGKLTSAQIDQLLAKQKQVNITIEAAILAVNALSLNDVQAQLEVFRIEEGREQMLHDESKAEIQWASGPAFITCVELTDRLLQRVADVIVLPGACRSEVDWLSSAEMQYSVSFTGDWGAEYILRLSQDVAAKIASRMLDEDAPDTDLISDALKEFVNVVAGQICAALNNAHGLTCELSPPREYPYNEPVPFEGRKIAIFPLNSLDGMVEVALAVPK